MPVPTVISALNPAPSSNSPQGTEAVGPIMNEYIQAAFGFIAQLYQGGMIPNAAVNMNSQQINNLANGALAGDAVNFGQLSTYMPLAGGAFTGAVTSNSSLTLNGTGNLTVVSTANNAVTVQNNVSGGQGANLKLYDAATGTAKFIRCLSNSFGIINNAYSVVLVTVDDSGNLTAAANITAYSDERLKKDWSSLSAKFVDQLAEVKSGTYTRIESNARSVGVGAQSLQKVMPEAVMSDEQGILSVAYGQAALAAAVELAKEVVLLRRRIEELEGEQ
jgi:hypothetical protein